REIVGSVNRKALEAIAREKMEDMNAGDVGAAMRILEGTARSMGIAITD
ncbi:MAG: 50S ribosomal protein L11, partial [Planctomycetes bacterium]|nr:50S ribosomal protein L11 [Planctomycetota bacterium]